MKNRWKHIVVTLAFFVLAIFMFMWVKTKFQNLVRIDTTQTEEDFTTHHEKVEFLSDLSALVIPESAEDITFTKTGWQDHFITGKFRLSEKEIEPFVDTIPNAEPEMVDVYRYHTDDDRASGSVTIDRKTGWVEIDASSD